jgi:hypothetical protein
MAHLAPFGSTGSASDGLVEEPFLPGFIRLCDERVARKQHTPGKVTEVDVRPLPDEAFEQTYAAWLRYGVLRLRNQRIDEDQLQAFSARFASFDETLPVAGMMRVFAGSHHQ